jgi:hypothetical protein
MGNRSFVYPGLSQAPAGPAGSAQPKAKTIPFDYVFKFDLKGVKGNKVQDVVEISMEGVFVTVSIGYSAAREGPNTFVPPFNSQITPQPPVLVPLLAGDASKPVAQGAVVTAVPEAQIAVLEVPQPGDPPRILVEGPAEANGSVTMKWSPDTDSGRFLRAWDKTNGLLSEVVQVGTAGRNTVKGNPTTPVIGPPVIMNSLGPLPAVGATAVTVFGSITDTVDLFLLPASAAISGPLDRVQLMEPFMGTQTAWNIIDFTLLTPSKPPLAAGDALLVRSIASDALSFSMYSVPRQRTFSTISIGEIADGLESVDADLTQGFRLNSTFANLLTADVTLDSLSDSTKNRAFEAGSRASEEVSFLYSIDVLGSGRELQNKAIHNVAGLGIANGDRPFRPLAKPVAFEPRSSIRIQIEEIETLPATLFIVLQGYKLLGTGRLGG